MQVHNDPTSLLDADSITEEGIPFMPFNGTSQYIEIPDKPELRLSKFSIALWFRTSKDYSANPAREGIMLMKGGWGLIFQVNK